MKKIVGANYLHSHPHMEKILGVDAFHVIVDKNAWEEVVYYFRRFPGDVEHLALPEVDKLFKNTDIDVVGNCANCGVEYHIHKP